MIPEFIYFDLGNVLFKFDHHIACRQMAEVAGVDEERMWQLIFESGLEAKCETGELDGRQLYEILCRETGTRPDFDALELAGSAIFEVNVPMLPVVTNLNMAGYRLGILSNTSESHWNYLADGRYALLPDTFEIAILSYEVGAMKPDAKIYEVAAKMAGVAPEKIFFMDDRQENVEGALRAGFDAVLFTTALELTRELRRRGVRLNL